MTHFEVMVYFAFPDMCASQSTGKEAVLVRYSKAFLHQQYLGGGNSNMFVVFTSKIGKDEPILTNIFQRGWFNHQRDIVC